jgi:plastin-1
VPRSRPIVLTDMCFPCRKFPQLDQGEIFSLQDAFNRLDVDDRGYLDESAAIKAAQQSERKPYDVVRQALKDVELDSSRRVEIEDYIDVREFFIPTW